MPSFLAGENHHKVPAAALWLTNAVIQAFLIVTWFADYAFTLALKMTSAMTLLPYLLVAAYGLRLAWTGETYAANRRSRGIDWTRAAAATLYAAGMLYAGGPKFLLLSALLYAPGTILFALARKFGIPFRFIGVGESIADLRGFTATDFVNALLPERLD